jgi:uncharacterized protein
MSAAEAQSEPTMEEILASIRKIISEDDVKPAEPEMDNSGFDDVLDLGSEMAIPEVANSPVIEDHVSADFDFDSLGFEEEANESSFQEVSDFDDYEADEIIAIDPEPEPEPEPEPVLETPRQEPVYFDPPPQPAPIYNEAPVNAPRVSNVPPQLEKTIGLIGADAANAASEAFSRLGSSLPGHFASGASVEELVAYLLKPMLKEWLDSNLPRIVEERVEAELARIARRGF